MNKSYNLFPLLLLIVFQSCQCVQKTDRSTNSLVDKFVGTWTLIEWTAQSPDGEITYPFGHEVKGRIMYDCSGNMSVQLLRNDRARFASDDPWVGTIEEIRTAYQGFFAYYGKFTINKLDQIVTHHLEMCSFPNWIGTTQVRYFQFDEDRLILSTPPIKAENVNKTNRLVWKKELQL